jgi:hypothetical protein
MKLGRPSGTWLVPSTFPTAEAAGYTRLPSGAGFLWSFCQQSNRKVSFLTDSEVLGSWNHPRMCPPTHRWPNSAAHVARRSHLPSLGREPKL